MKTCPLCSTQYPTHVAFCFKDGHPLVVVAQVPPPPSLPPEPLSAGAEEPLSLDGYRLEQVLNAGYSSVVYKVQDGGGATYAMRILAPSLQDRAQTREAFLARAAFQAGLKHPVLVRTLKVIRKGGVSAALNELIKGVDLERASRTLSAHPALIADLGARAALALGELHRAPPPQQSPVVPIHGQLSPRRIMLLPDGALRLLGGGHVPGPLPAAIQANNGLFACLAPEQIEQAPLDSRTDIYSLCLVLRTLAGGSNPRLRPQIDQTLRAAREPVPTVPHTVDGELDLALHALLREGMDPDPYRRLASAEELAMSLRALPGLPEEDVLAAEWAEVLRELFPNGEVAAVAAFSNSPAWAEREELEDRVWSAMPRRGGRRATVPTAPTQAPVPAPEPSPGIEALVGALDLPEPATLGQSAQAPAASEPAAQAPASGLDALDLPEPATLVGQLTPLELPATEPGTQDSSPPDWPTEPALSPGQEMSAQLRALPPLEPEQAPPAEATAEAEDPQIAAWKDLVPEPEHAAELLVQTGVPEALLQVQTAAEELAPEPKDEPITPTVKMHPAQPAVPPLKPQHPPAPEPEDIAAWDQSPGPGPEPGLAPEPAPPVKKGPPVVLFAAIGVVVLLAVGIFWSLGQKGDPTPTPTPAEIKAPAQPTPPPAPVEQPVVEPPPVEAPVEAPVDQPPAPAPAPVAAPVNPTPPVAAPVNTPPKANPTPTPPKANPTPTPPTNTPPKTNPTPTPPKPAEDDPWGGSSTPPPEPQPKPTNEDNPWG